MHSSLVNPDPLKISLFLSKLIDGFRYIIADFPSFVKRGKRTIFRKNRSGRSRGAMMLRIRNETIPDANRRRSVKSGLLRSNPRFPENGRRNLEAEAENERTFKGWKLNLRFPDFQISGFLCPGGIPGAGMEIPAGEIAKIQF